MCKLKESPEETATLYQEWNIVLVHKVINLYEGAGDQDLAYNFMLLTGK